MRSIEFSETGVRRERNRPAEEAGEDVEARRLAKRERAATDERERLVGHLRPLATEHMTRKRNDERIDGERQREREQKRREFEEHHRVQHDVTRLRGTEAMKSALDKVKKAAQRLTKGRNARNERKLTARKGIEQAHKQTRAAMLASPQAAGNDNHVLLPMPAVNKAAEARELQAISLCIQGAVLVQGEAKRSGVATYGQGPHKAALALSAEDRAELIGMYEHARKYLPLPLMQMLDVITMQTLASADPRVPTISQVGELITRSEDERVKKGGVIGYYRALFQSIEALQREYRIKQAVRQLQQKRERGSG